LVQSLKSPPARHRERWFERLARAGYSLLFIGLLPLIALRLLYRSLSQPAYRKSWSQRFLGKVPARLLATDVDQTDPSGGIGPRLWLHAVSVGETRAVAPLIRAWLTRHPYARVMLTQTTPTGRQTAQTLFEDLLGSRVFLAYCPLDFPWSVHRFLSELRPDALVLMETELWPNLLTACHTHQVPVALVNARLSERSFQRFRRLAWLSAPALGGLAAVIPQSQVDAQRFQTAGANQVLPAAGSLKFDVQLDPHQIAVGQAWRSRWSHRQVWLAASTRDDEEEALLRAFAEQRPPGVLLIVVPRHPERFDRVEKIAAGYNLSRCRRSKLPESLDQDMQLLLGDSLGEMQAFVAASDLCLIGGSLLPLGGQNPIEACAQGRPVFFGPHMFNFESLAQELLDCGAGFRIASAHAFVHEAYELGRSLPRQRLCSQAARSFVEARQGATEKTLDVLDALIR
jgi:3-deoxy-D-manno-octulosonic-acid transferase